MSERREAAKRLCYALDRLGILALPDGPTMTVVGVLNGSRQAVALRTMAGRGLVWCFVWGSELDPVMHVGQETAMAQRIHQVLSIPAVEEVTL